MFRAAAALIGLLHRSRKRCERRRLEETDGQWWVNVIVGRICLYVVERGVCVCEREVRTFMHYLSLYSMQHCCSWIRFWILSHKVWHEIETPGECFGGLVLI